MKSLARLSAARVSAVGLAAYTAVLFVGLLAPFDRYTRNEVRWAPDGQSLQFLSTGVARSASKPKKLHDRLVAAGRLSIEVWASPADTRQGGPARIVSYSESTRRRNFTVGQEGNDLVVRLRTTRTNLNGSVPRVVVKDVFSVPGFRHIVMTYDGVHERVYVDGEPRITTDKVQGAFANWDPEHWLVVGNEHTALRPWRGALRLLAIYDRVLAPGEVTAHHENLRRGDAPHLASGLIALYRFGQDVGRVADESAVLPRVDLDIPGIVEPVPPLLTLRLDSPSDLVLNVVIFVPVGLLTALTLLRLGAATRGTVVMTLALAAALSLTAEVAQHFVLSRSSELNDVILNIAGASLGASLSFLSRRYCA